MLVLDGARDAISSISLTVAKGMASGLKALMERRFLKASSTFKIISGNQLYKNSAGSGDNPCRTQPVDFGGGHSQAAQDGVGIAAEFSY